MLDTARRQFSHFRDVLTPENGQTRVELASNNPKNESIIEVLYQDKSIPVGEAPIMSFLMPGPILTKFKRGIITGEEAINKMGSALLRFCQDNGFQVV